MRVYADTNFLTQLYIRRPESERAESLVASARTDGLNHLPITWLLLVETVNAFEQYVFLSRTVGTVRITVEQASVAHQGFKDDVQSGEFLIEKPVPLLELTNRCNEFARRHTARQGFRVYDLIHVASALLLGCEHFWSFDQRARKLAALEGLKLNTLD
jgi:predicted nucleic acid-binding protein